MTDQQPDRLRKMQADLIDLSGRLNNLAKDFQELAGALPTEMPGGADLRRQAPIPSVPFPPGIPPQSRTQPPPAIPGGGPQPGRYPPPFAPTPSVPAAGGVTPNRIPAGQTFHGQIPPGQIPPGHIPPRQTTPASVRFAGAPTAATMPLSAPPPAAQVRAPRRQVSIAEIFSVAGSAITLLGVAFVLLLPADGFLGQLPRAGIGLGLAAIAVVVALVQHRKEPGNIGSQALMATGVASAFLSVLALSSLYHDAAGRPLIPEIAGIALAGVISLGGVSVARWWRSQWLSVLAVLGSLILAPYLGGGSALWPMTFMLVMTLVTAAFQHKLDWSWLLAARVIPTVGYFVWVLMPFAHTPTIDPTIGLGLAFVLAAGGLGIAVLHQEGSFTMSALGVAAMVATTAPMMLAIWLPDRSLAVALTAALGAIFAAAGLLSKLFSAQLRAASVPIGAAFVTVAVIRFTDGDYLGYLFFTLAAAYFALAAATRFKPVFVVAWVLGILGVLQWMPSIVALFVPTQGYEIEQLAESLLGLLATLLAVRAMRTFQQESGSGLIYVSWMASVTFGSVALVIAGTTIGIYLNDVWVGFQTAHALVTVTWLLLSVWLLRRGLRRDRDAVAAVRLAIALAIAAVAKLFLFDLSTLPDLVRALAFLAVGVLMLVIGTWYHRQLEKARRPAQAPQSPAAPDDSPSDQQL